MTFLNPNEPMDEAEWAAYARSALSSWLGALELLANGKQDEAFNSPAHKAVVDSVDIITRELTDYVPLTAVFLAISDGMLHGIGDEPS